MKTLQELDLHVSSLGVKHTRNLFGGDYWGGYIAGGFCSGSSGSSSYFNDLYYLLSSYYWNHLDPDYGGGGESGADYWSNHSSESDDVPDGYTFSYNLSDADKAILTEAMEALPEEFQRQNVKIYISPELLALLDLDGSSMQQNACFLHKGHIVHLPNGGSCTIMEDMIVCRDAEHGANALWEECLHQWQYQNCVYSSDNPKITANIVNAMELQADIIEAMQYYANNFTPTENSTTNTNVESYPRTGIPEVDLAIMDYYDPEKGTYDINALGEVLDHYIYYNENNVVSPDYDFKWSAVLNLFYGYANGHPNSLWGKFSY